MWGCGSVGYGGVGYRGVGMWGCGGVECVMLDMEVWVCGSVGM